MLDGNMPHGHPIFIGFLKRGLDRQWIANAWESEWQAPAATRLAAVQNCVAVAWQKGGQAQEENLIAEAKQTEINKEKARLETFYSAPDN